MSESESDIETSEDDYFSDDEEMAIKIIFKSFAEVADVTLVGDNEFDLDFFEPNQLLIEDEENYVFELEDGVPILHDPKYFIVFCNKLKSLFPNLTGIKLSTNLEGGGELTI